MWLIIGGLLVATGAHAGSDLSNVQCSTMLQMTNEDGSRVESSFYDLERQIAAYYQEQTGKVWRKKIMKQVYRQCDGRPDKTVKDAVDNIADYKEY